jgi:hypothetical protein
MVARTEFLLLNFKCLCAIEKKISLCMVGEHCLLEHFHGSKNVGYLLGLCTVWL